MLSAGIELCVNHDGLCAAAYEICRSVHRLWGPRPCVRGWDWCSGYHYSDSLLVGFAHTHLSGTGCGDLGDVRFLPVSDAGQTELKFSHADEKCRAGYYALRLNYPEGGYSVRHRPAGWKAGDIPADGQTTRNCFLWQSSLKTWHSTRSTVIRFRWFHGRTAVSPCL